MLEQRAANTQASTEMLNQLSQLRTVEGRLPDMALACVGGGSNAIGLLARFIGEPSVRLAVAERVADLCLSEARA